MGRLRQRRDVFDDPDRIAAKLASYVAGVSELFGDGRSWRCTARITRSRSRATPTSSPGSIAIRTAFRVQVTTLGDYVGATTRDQSDTERTWTGELRSGARANILMGVVSNRVDVQAAAARPSGSCTATPSRWRRSTAATWPERCLELAAAASSRTRLMTRSARVLSTRSWPRSSVRFAEAAQIGTGCVERALARIAEASAGGRIAVQPVAGRAQRVVEIEIAGRPNGRRWSLRVGDD